MIENCCKDLTSPLEVLYDHYFENRGKDSAAVEAAYKVFCHSLLEVDPLLVDDILGSVAALCMEHEHSGFMAGAKVCCRFIKELSE